MAGSAFYPHVWYTGILCRRDGSFHFSPKPESRPTKKTLMRVKQYNCKFTACSSQCLSIFQLGGSIKIVGCILLSPFLYLMRDHLSFLSLFIPLVSFFCTILFHASFCDLVWFFNGLLNVYELLIFYSTGSLQIISIRIHVILPLLPIITLWR